MKPITIGTHVDTNQSVTLNERDLECHIMCSGSSGSGKSRLMQIIGEQLCEAQSGFFMIDPKGGGAKETAQMLAHKLVKCAAYMEYGGEWVIQNNFFLAGGVDSKVEALGRASGEDLQKMPRTAKWLPVLFEIFKATGIGVNEVMTLLSFPNTHLRMRVRNTLLTNPIALALWDELLQCKNLAAYRAEIESVQNRFFTMAKNPMLRRILGTRECFPWERPLLEGWPVILNCQPSEGFSAESGRLIATLALHRVWEIVRSRKRKLPKPFFTFCDEAGEILTKDSTAILDRARSFDFHLGLFFQHVEQIKSQICGQSALEAIERGQVGRLGLAGHPKTPAHEILHRPIIFHPQAAGARGLHKGFQKGGTEFRAQVRFELPLQVCSLRVSHLLASFLLVRRPFCGAERAEQGGCGHWRIPTRTPAPG
jgi:hypothetical protein